MVLVFFFFFSVSFLFPKEHRKKKKSKFAEWGKSLRYLHCSFSEMSNPYLTQSILNICQTTLFIRYLTKHSFSLHILSMINLFLCHWEAKDSYTSPDWHTHHYVSAFSGILLPLLTGDYRPLYPLYVFSKTVARSFLFYFIYFYFYFLSQSLMSMWSHSFSLSVSSLCLHFDEYTRMVGASLIDSKS